MKKLLFILLFLASGCTFKIYPVQECTCKDSWGKLTTELPITLPTTFPPLPVKGQESGLKIFNHVLRLDSLKVFSQIWRLDSMAINGSDTIKYYKGWDQ
jgi:hypothetical protein